MNLLNRISIKFISLFTCKHEVCDESIGRFIPPQKFGYDKSGTIDNYLNRARNHPIVNSSKIVVNKYYFEKVGGFPENARVSEDLFMWIKMDECAPIIYCNDLLVSIHQTPDDSRHSRIGEVPYPIVYYTKDNLTKNKNIDLYLYLWNLHLNHVLGSCASNKNEALTRIEKAVLMRMAELKQSDS